MKPETFPKDFPVVCVGGSAGGLDAYIRLLTHLPADMGVAIVIVNHLRHVDTQLHEILPRYTKMPVELITEGLDLRPNHVFIIPPQRDLHVLVREGHEAVRERRVGRGRRRQLRTLDQRREQRLKRAREEGDHLQAVRVQGRRANAVRGERQVLRELHDEGPRGARTRGCGRHCARELRTGRKVN